MFKWNPIDTAPKEGFRSFYPGVENGPTILLATYNGHIAIGFWNGRSWDDGDWHDNMGEFDLWAPLPEVPPSLNASISGHKVVVDG